VTAVSLLLLEGTLTMRALLSVFLAISGPLFAAGAEGLVGHVEARVMAGIH
jgi:hypothetical protein